MRKKITLLLICLFSTLFIQNSQADQLHPFGESPRIQPPFAMDCIAERQLYRGWYSCKERNQTYSLLQDFFAAGRKVLADMPSSFVVTVNIYTLDELDVNIENRLKELENTLHEFGRLTEAKQLQYLEEFYKVAHACYKDVTESSIPDRDVEHNNATFRYFRLLEIMEKLETRMPRIVRIFYEHLDGNFDEEIISAYLFPLDLEKIPEYNSSLRRNYVDNRQLAIYGFSSQTSDSSTLGETNCQTAVWVNAILSLELLYHYQLGWSYLGWHRIEFKHIGDKPAEDRFSVCRRQSYSDFLLNLQFYLLKSIPDNNRFHRLYK